MNATNRMLRNALVAVLAAAPLAASAQNPTNLSVAVAPLSDLTIYGRRDPNEGQLTYGQSKVYAVTITNTGLSTAQGVELDFPSLDPRVEVGTVTGCSLHESFDPATNTTAIHPNLPGSWPCKLANISDPIFSGTTIVPGSNATEVDVTVAWATFVDTVCPTTAAIVLAPSTFTVSATNAANSSATDQPVTGALANLNISLSTPVTEGGEGTPFTVTATIQNAGPCTAPDVQVADRDGVSDVKMSFVSSTGCLLDPGVSTTVDTTVDPVNSPPCKLGDLASGATATMTATYTVGAMNSDELQRGTIVNYDVYTKGRSYFVNRPASGDGRVYDPDEGDNVSTVKILSKQDVSTCATGGIPTPLALLALGLLAFRRRRS